MIRKTAIALTAVFALGAASSALAATENDVGVSIYIPQYGASDAYAQVPQARVRQPSFSKFDANKVLLERSTKDISAY
jgi:hypothetical protein